MRDTVRTMWATALGMVMAFGGGAVTAVTAMAPEPTNVVVMKGPPEDSRNFDCRKHGNRQCAFKIDVHPNKPGGVRWYTADFKSKKFALQAWRYR